MSPVEGPAGRSGAPAGETDATDAPEQGTRGCRAQATTLLVAHVEGRERSRAMALSPDAILRLLTQSRGRVVHLTTADNLDGAVRAVKAIDACRTGTAGRTAPLPAGGTAPLPSAHH